MGNPQGAGNVAVEEIDSTGCTQISSVCVDYNYKTYCINFNYTKSATNYLSEYKYSVLR